MFKKLKDKIAEEVKQSPLKFQTSVQQLTQAVTSTSLNSLINSEIMPEEEDDVNIKKNELSDDSILKINPPTNNSEYDNSFTTIDLRSPTPTRNRRSSSTSTINSELFPIYELPSNRYVLQSDLESNSEFDDGSSIQQFGNVSKENLYQKYRAMLQKYHKYRGRFSDAQKYCQELQRGYDKAKNILTETQDKAIKLNTELRRQCSSLKNELEERDHIIDTLNTKITLLKTGKDCEQIDQQGKFKSDILSKDSLKNDNHMNELNSFEIENLKEKIKNFELLLNKAKNAITNKNVQIQELQANIELNEKELTDSHEQIVNLQSKIEMMKMKEEDALLSLAENKLIIHKELETKESQIKNLKDKIAENEKDVKQLKMKLESEKNMNNDALSNQSNTREDEIKILQQEVEQLKMSLQEKDSHINEFKSTVEYSNKELIKLKNEMEASNCTNKPINSEILKLFNELTEYQNTIKTLELSILNKKEEFDKLCVEKNLQEKSQNDIIVKLKQELSHLKWELSEKETTNETLKNQIRALKETIESTNLSLNNKDEQLKIFNDTIIQLETELSSANDKIKENLKDKKLWEEMETHLKADKIILEETMKTVKNELNITQEKLKNAKINLEKYEEDMKMSSEVSNKEKQVLENLLTENEKQLQYMSNQLEIKNKTEQEMLVQTATFLEEINSLKTKEDNYLSEIRKLKTNLTQLQNVNDEVRNLNVKLKECEEKYWNTCERNKIFKLENDSLKSEIETVRKQITDFDSLAKNHKSLQKKYDNLKYDEEKWMKDIEESKKIINQNECLNKENETLRNNIETLNEKIVTIEKLCQEKELPLLKEIETLNQEKKQLQTLTEQLKQSAVIVSSFHPAEAKENLKTLSDHTNFTQTENEFLKTEQQKWQQHAEDIIKYGEENEQLRNECNMYQYEQKELESKLREQGNKHRILLHEYNVLLNNIHQNEDLKYETEDKIKSITKELDDLKIINEQLRNENESYAITCEDMKLFVYETKSILEQTYQYRNNIQEIENVNKKIIKENKELLDELSNLRCKNLILIEENEIFNKEVMNMKSNVQTSNNINEKIHNINHNLLKKCKEQILNLKSDYSELKGDLFNHLNILKQYCYDNKTEINKRLQNIIEKYLKLYAELENSFKDIENQCTLLKNENNLLKNEKQDLLTKIEYFSNKIGKHDENIQNIENKEFLHMKNVYAEEIKEIIAGYEIRLAEKDNEYEKLHNKIILKNDRENVFIQRETKEIIQNLQEDLTNKQDTYEKLLDKYNYDTQELNQKISEFKELHTKEIKEIDKKWKLCLDKKIAEIKEKHKEEINELTKEWATDRKFSNFNKQCDNNLNTKFLENSARHYEDNEALKTQVQVLSNELHNYKKSHWRDIDLNMLNISYNTTHSDISLEDCTEMEYLRNILFEYMMGHQPLVLAKVLAAIVKFDNKQTKLVLQKEEQKQTLLGQFGLT